MKILREKKFGIFGNLFKKLNHGESYAVYNFRFSTPNGVMKDYFNSLSPQEKEDFVKLSNEKRSLIINNYKLNQKLQEEKNIESQLRNRLPKEFWDFRDSVIKNGLSNSTDLSGDGDEYAVVSFEDMKNIKSGLDSGKRFPIYRNSIQWGRVEYDPISKKFIDSDTGKIIPNLKKHTKNIFNTYLKDWEKGRYWEDDENEKVINHLKKANKL